MVTPKLIHLVTIGAMVLLAANKSAAQDRSYLILFPSNGNKLFLEKHTRNDYWELPGGGVETKDKGSHFSAMKREWKEETGIDLPWLNKKKNFNIGHKHYYAAQTDSTLSSLPSNGRLHGKWDEVNRWTLMTVDQALGTNLRGDHREALKYAKRKNSIGRHGLQI